MFFDPITYDMIKSASNKASFLLNFNDQNKIITKKLFIKHWRAFIWEDLAKDLLSHENYLIFKEDFLIKDMARELSERSERLLGNFLHLYERKLTKVESILKQVNRLNCDTSQR